MHSFLGLVAFSLLIAATDGPAIRVDTCGVQLGAPAETYEVNHWRTVARFSVPETPARVTIRFVNTSSKTASAILFGIYAGDEQLATIRDKGTYAPGASIDHTFSVDYELLPAGTTGFSCRTIGVEYAASR